MHAQISVGTWGECCNEIYNNEIHYGGYGLECKQHSTVDAVTLYSRNDIYNLDPYNYGKCGAYLECDMTIVRYNSIYDGGSDGMTFYALSSNYPTIDNHVYSNVIWNQVRAGHRFGAYDEYNKRNKFINNVYAKNVVSASRADWGEITDGEHFDNPFADAQENEFNNNYIVSYASGSWEDDYLGSVVDWDSGSHNKLKVSTMENTYAGWSNNIFNYCDPKFVDPVHGDFTTQSETCLQDKGRDLAQTNGLGTGSTSLVVDDARFFWYSDVSGKGDQIIIGGDTNKVRGINAIDYATNTITLDSPVSWNDGDSINIFKTFSDPDTLRFSDAAPDIGVFEYQGTASPTCQNQEYECCDSCQSGPHPEYDGNCSGKFCCESCVGCVHEAEAEPCDGCVYIYERTSYIGICQINSAAVPLPDLMGAIGLFHSGAGC
jgi:hypothetical protein